MWLGIDLGTSSIKCAVVDDVGAVVTTTRSAYAVAHPTADAGEIDPALWWQALVDALAQLPAPLRQALRGIGLSGQMHGVVVVDHQGRVCAPAQLWMDRRALAELARYPDPVRGPCGNRSSPGMAGPMLLRLVRLALCDDAEKALQPKDWLGWRLTGEFVTDPSDASATLLAGNDGAWDAALLNRLGLPAHWLAATLASHQSRGGLRAEVAAELGLPGGIPVAVGAGDTAAALLGNGRVALGDAQLTVGTGAQLVVIGDPGLHSAVNRFRSALPRPAWYAMAAMLNAGLALDWARAMLSMSWDQAYSSLQVSASLADPVFLPYLSGERVPFHDPSLRGGWLGLSTADSQESLMRAAFVGVACAIRAGLDSLRSQGLKPEALNLAGGGNRNPDWQQLLADILGLPLIPAGVADASARGAALLGGVAGGAWRIDALPAPPSGAEAIVPRSQRVGETLVQRFRGRLERLR
jgi:sugar (pentulose or hexulose) kinase